MLALLILATVAAREPVPTAGTGVQQHDMTELSLEELMNVEVTVASRSEQKLADTPAAVYVITGDEVRRSGHTTVQEALRMVPGFLVGHWYTSAWDVTARGFTSGFNNNLLVMIDGVNVYDQFSADGVVWRLQDIDIDDLDRIEVVRGPGAALWGNNAVNGVINVVTKKAAETQGWKLASLVGDEELRASLRFGAEAGDNGHFRVNAQGNYRDALRGDSASGSDIAYQDYSIYKLGFRGDWEYENGDSLSFIANAYDTSVGERYPVGIPTPPYVADVTDDTQGSGGNVAIIWKRSHGADGDDRVVASYLRADQREVDFESAIDIVDVDWQRNRPVGEYHTLTYGLGLRVVDALLEGDFIWAFRPEHTNTYRLRAFLLDEIRVPSADLRFVLGSGLEDNELTGLEWQPTARAIWTPSAHQALWAAVSRAVRTPSLQESYDYSQQVLGPPTDIYLSLGNEDLDSEELIAYEFGWRWQAHQRLSFDCALFYNQLDRLVTRELQSPFNQGGNTYFPETYGNLGSATSWGLELAADAVLTEDWRLRAAYTTFEQSNELDPDSTDPSFETQDRLVPDNIANLRSYYDLGEHWELDLGLYYVDSLSVLDTPAYVRSDVRLGFQPGPDWQFAVGVQNLNDPDHPEDGGYLVERNLWFSFRWSR